jgi:hypothetical protein
MYGAVVTNNGSSFIYDYGGEFIPTLDEGRLLFSLC